MSGHRVGLRPDRGADGGFTLIELLIAVVLSAIIGGVIVSVLATSLNVASSTTEQVADSTDASLISAFLYRDAAAAGATDPSTAQLDGRAGVSSIASPDGCVGAPVGSVKVRFSWLDPAGDPAYPMVVATYSLDENSQLTRRLCRHGHGDGSGVATDLILGRRIAAATLICSPNPVCGGLAGEISLTVVGSGSRSPFEYTLTASLRSDEQAPPSPIEATPVPLIALGPASLPCPHLTLVGAARVNVRGDSVTGTRCGAAPSDVPGLVTGSGSSFRELTGITDPFAGIVAPAATCSGGANAGPIGASAGPSDVIVYPAAVSIDDSASFAPGRYVFCAGLEIGSGATVAGTGVLLYIAGGSLDVVRAATVDLTPAADGSGDYANMLIWVATPQVVTLAGGTRVNSFRGYIYAPSSQLVFSGPGAMNIGGAVAGTIAFQGGATAGIGRSGPLDLVTIGTAAALPVAQVALAYPGSTLTASGGAAPYTWSATGLPVGMTLGTTGLLSGTPAAAGTFAATVTVLDSTLAASSATYPLTVNEALAVATSALPAGQVGVTYPETAIATSGGTGPFSWAVAGLPDGLGIDATTGVVSGNPTVPGLFPVVVTVTDSYSLAARATATASFTLVVKNALAITPNALATGQVGVAYSATFEGTGGSTPYAWSVTGLPAGLDIDPTNGVISGIPTASGTFTVVVDATDSANATAVTSSALVITPAVTVGETALGTGQVGSVYPVTTLVSSGGTAPYTWSATGLPAGLALDTSTGELSGTPTAAGTFTVVVTVVDAISASSSATYSVTINATLTVATPSVLPAGQIGVTYIPTAVGVAGGTGPFSWAVTGLPAGLTMDPSNGVLSGSPTVSGSFPVVVTVTDSYPATATKSYTLVVKAALVVTPKTLTSGEVGVAYPATFVATGGTTPYVWSVTGLPAGLVMSTSTGVISGTPTTSGTYSVVAKARDAVGATSTATSSLLINPVLAMGSNNVRNGQVAAAYPSTTLASTGGTAPYTWTATSLPSGVTIVASTGVMAGTPTTAATYNVVIKVTDARGASQSVTYPVTIIPALVVASPSTLPAGQLGLTYTTTTVASSGGTRPVTWSVTGLPAGLVMDTATGVISGGPTAAGSFTVKVTVTDSYPTTAIKTYTLVVKAALAVTAKTLTSSEVGVVYPTATFAATGGTTPYAWSVTGLPPGLTMNASTGAITGSPTAAGTYSLVVTARDAAGATASTTSSLLINPVLAMGSNTVRNGQLAVVYPTTTLVSTGGTAAYTWTSTGLPAGLKIVSTTGVLSGTPTAAGTYNVVIKVTDGRGASSSVTYPVTITPALTVSAPSAFPSGQVRVTYATTTATSSGGTAPVTMSVTGLPAGLTMDTSTGVVSGTPTASGTFTVKITVTDSYPVTVTRSYTLVVRAALAVTAKTLTAGRVGVVYPTATFAATGGLTPYVWSVTGLPAGLTMNTSTGAITGTPTVTGTFSVVVVATDAVNATATTTSSLQINP